MIKTYLTDAEFIRQAHDYNQIDCVEAFERLERLLDQGQAELEALRTELREEQENTSRLYEENRDLRNDVQRLKDEAALDDDMINDLRKEGDELQLKLSGAIRKIEQLEKGAKNGV